MVGSSRGTEGLSHAGEAGQAQRNRLEVGRGSVLGSAERRGQSQWGPERCHLHYGGRGLPNWFPAGLQAQPWHLNGQSRRWVGA